MNKCDSPLGLPYSDDEIAEAQRWFQQQSRDLSERIRKLEEKGARCPRYEPVPVKCEIGWIDCHGARTPDNNEAVGFAVIGKLKFPVCADHARTIGSGRCHHGACVHMTSGPSSWTFEPFATEV